MPVTPAAQITICGALSDDTIAALVRLAMSAGAALLVQPRGPTARLALTGEVVDVVSPPPQMDTRTSRPAPAGRPVSHTSTPPQAGRGARDIPEAQLALARRVLARGALPVAELLRHTKLSKFQARQLVADGVLVATGVTRSRRYALPGSPAKEAP